MKEFESKALSIYVAAGRDPIDAIDMIKECGDMDVLKFLLQMLTMPGTPRTDRELNDLLAPSVERRLAEINQ